MIERDGGGVVGRGSHTEKFRDEKGGRSPQRRIV